ncbi:hypothetical protein GYA28_03375 [Candidatus Roizmanbacteria bacterium]|nr:hypothetical protein [Candidatus Roizmanbacteria bacterium]
MDLPLKKKLTNILFISAVTLVFAYAVFRYVYFNQNTQKKSRAAGETISLYFSQAAVSLNSGNGTASLSLMIDPESAVNLRAFTSRINFDKTRIEVTGIDYKIGSVRSDGDDGSNLQKVNSNGYIDLSSQIVESTGKVLAAGQPAEAVVISIKKLKSDSSIIPIQESLSSVYKISGDTVISVQPVAVFDTVVNPTQALNLTVCPSGTVVKDKCAFVGGEGIQKAVNVLPVKIDTTGVSNLSSTITVKSGDYLKDTVSKVTTKTGTTLNCFIDTKNKYLNLVGENTTKLDGKNSKAKPQFGVCAGAGTINIKKILFTGFSRVDGVTCLSQTPTETCFDSAGVNLYDSAVANITGNVFKENGGVGVLVSQGAQAVIKNSIFYKNERPGVVSGNGGSLKAINNTFVANKTAGLKAVKTLSLARALSDSSVLGTSSASVKVYPGSGSDGDIAVTGTVNINTQPLISQRSTSCADKSQQGDAVNFSVFELGADYARVKPTPAANCLVNNDEVLLINLEGTTSSWVNTGNYEALRIKSISGDKITFTTNKVKYYGENSNDDTNLGTTNNTQRVMLQRVPNYKRVTVNGSAVFTVSKWDGARGGVMFFRASDRVDNFGTINTSDSGWRGGSGGTSFAGGAGGESFCAGNSLQPSTSGGASGGQYGTNGYSNNNCGGGGGGGGYGYGSTYGAYNGSSGTSGKGGAGGGGGGAYAGHSSYHGLPGSGGGGGYGSPGAGGQGGYGSNNPGVSGGVSGSGAGGTGSYGWDWHGRAGGGGGGGVFATTNANLTKLYFGSGGGGGGAGEVSQSSYTGSNGGAGGGIVYIASDTINASGGFIYSNGGAGASNGSYGGGGGGGAGGSIKLIGNTVNLGTNSVNAVGGAGGSGWSNSYVGGAGGSGRIACYYKTNISGTANPAYGSVTEDTNSDTVIDANPETGDGTIYLSNNIFAENISDGKKGLGIDIPKELEANLTLAYNLFWNNASGCATDSLWCVIQSSLNNADPKFINKDGADFHLKSDSPARKKGSPDILNPDGSVSDVGAFGGPGVCDLDSQASGCQAATTLTPTITVTSAVTPTTTITPYLSTSPAPVIVSLKLKFQGITKKPASGLEKMTVKAKVENATYSQSLDDVSFTSDDKGIWTGSLTLTNVKPGSGYKFFIKGPKHVQKKICDALPAESYAGTYHCEDGRITLQAGSNNLDFTNIYLLSGDLPSQDGIVNSYDTSLVRNNIGKTDGESIKLADINLDKVVDTQDYSLVINALSIRSDEGEQKTITLTPTSTPTKTPTPSITLTPTKIPTLTITVTVSPTVKVTVSPTVSPTPSSTSLMRDGTTYGFYASNYLNNCQGISSPVDSLLMSLISTSKTHTNVTLDSSKNTPNLYIGDFNINNIITKDCSPCNADNLSFNPNAGLTIKKQSTPQINYSSALDEVIADSFEFCSNSNGCSGVTDAQLQGKKFLLLKNIAVCPDL